MISTEKAVDTYQEFFRQVKHVITLGEDDPYPFEDHSCQDFNSTLAQKATNRYCLLGSKSFIDISNFLPSSLHHI